MCDNTDGHKAQGALVSAVVLAGVPVLPDAEIEATKTEKHGQQVTDIKVHRWSLARRTGNGDGEIATEKGTAAMHTTETDITLRYRNAIRWWARAIADIETFPAEHLWIWVGHEMGVEAALSAVSMDLGWSDDEWQAVEAAARKQAKEIIAERNSDGHALR